jgi:hypothetical protein
VKEFSANRLEESAHSVVETTNLQAHQKRALRQEALTYPHDRDRAFTALVRGTGSRLRFSGGQSIEASWHFYAPVPQFY